ncbi:MAG: MATE family efflux transporter [Phycisphaerales bacterium]|nr:MAG: MATE family efflux transporter [Phycisphaerales bacterium]
MSSEGLKSSERIEAGGRPGEWRGVVAMSIPVVVTTSSRAMMDVADYIMISCLRQDEAQAAILPAQLVLFCYIVLGMGIVSVVNTFTAQQLGRGRQQACGAYAWQGIYIAAIFGLLALAVIPGLPMVIAWMGHAPEVQKLELAYSRVALLTSGPSIAAAGLAHFFVGIHRPRVTMWTAIEGNLVNIAVSVVLIFGYLGFEPMGIAGAAWGTLAAVSYRTLRLTATLLMPRTARVFGSFSWRFSPRKAWDLVRVGTPCGFQWLAEVLGWALFVTVLVAQRFGTVHQIATNTAWQYLRVSFLPAMGLGIALTALVGKSIGAGQPRRAVRETRIALAMTVGYMGTLSLIYFLFRRTLIGWFNDDPEIIRIGAQVMVCAAVFQLFDAAGITYNSALRGAGDTFWPSMIYIGCTWGILMGGGYLIIQLLPEMGSLGPWLAASILIIVAASLLWWRWHSRAWMRINLFKGEDGRPGASSDAEERASACVTACEAR